MRNQKNFESGIAEIAGMDHVDNPDQDFDEFMAELDEELTSDRNPQCVTIH